MQRVASFQDSEKQRLKAYAARWHASSHVIPYEVAVETLAPDIRASALAYFAANGCKWWTGRADKRTEDMEARPTGHLNSSQVACVNHLEPARLDAAVAQQIVSTIDPSLVVLPLDDGFLSLIHI